jgi:hypothetical protein
MFLKFIQEKVPPPPKRKLEIEWQTNCYAADGESSGQKLCFFPSVLFNQLRVWAEVNFEQIF